MRKVLAGVLATALTAGLAAVLGGSPAHATAQAGCQYAKKQVMIKNRGSGQVLDVRGGATANKSTVQLWPARRNVNQRWYLYRCGTRADSPLVFQAVGSKKCLDMSLDGFESPPPVYIYSCTPASATRNQRWLPGPGGYLFNVHGWRNSRNKGPTLTSSYSLQLDRHIARAVHPYSQAHQRPTQQWVLEYL